MTDEKAGHGPASSGNGGTGAPATAGDLETEPSLEGTDPGGGNGRRSTRRRRHAVTGLVVVVLLAVSGAGVYGLVRNLQTTSNIRALDNLCSSVGYAIQLAYDHKGNLATFHKMVDKDAAGAGSQALSDTNGFEASVEDHRSLIAAKDLAKLVAICSSNGSPISTPVTT
jgi:hypothetical protein